MMFLTSIVKHIRAKGTVFDGDVEDSDLVLTNIWKTVFYNLVRDRNEMFRYNPVQHNKFPTNQNLTFKEEIGSRMGWTLTDDLSHQAFTKPDMIMAKIIAFQQVYYSFAFHVSKLHIQIKTYLYLFITKLKTASWFCFRTTAVTPQDNSTTFHNYTTQFHYCFWGDCAIFTW